MNRKALVGNPNQLMKARRITFREGIKDGVKAIELENRKGIYATVIEDQCLNLYDFSYRGINFSFQTKNGLASSYYFNGGTDQFSYYWPAGMLYTCGLANVGSPVIENGIFHPQHGRIGMTPAENVTLVETEEHVTVTGTIRDSFLCGHQLSLERKITVPTEGSEIRIQDTVINLEDTAAEMMLLYHCNFGYPLLAPGARVVKGSGEISDNLGSARHPGDCSKVTAPLPVKDEEVYCHTNTPDKNGYGYAAVVNDALALGCYVKYKMDTLPLLMQWKNFCTHEYAMGLEPSNTYILGREAERKNGTLPVLAPYESRSFEICIGVLDGKEEIASFERMLAEQCGKHRSQ